MYLAFLVEIDETSEELEQDSLESLRDAFVHVANLVPCFAASRFISAEMVELLALIDDGQLDGTNREMYSKHER